MNADAGPADDPLVAAGASIIESRYRGRSASWSFARSMMSTETYRVSANYVERPEEIAWREQEAEYLRTHHLPLPAEADEPPAVAAKPTPAEQWAPQSRTIKPPPKASVTPIRGNHGFYTSKPRNPIEHKPSVDEIAELGRALLDSAFGIGKPRR